MGTAFIIDDDANHNAEARAQRELDEKIAAAAAAKAQAEREAAAANAGRKFYFKALRAGPHAKLLVLDSYWEAAEMKSNPEYIRVHEDGTPYPDEEAGAETRIQFAPPQPEKRPAPRARR